MFDLSTAEGRERLTAPQEYEIFEMAKSGGFHYALDGYCACGLLTDECEVWNEGGDNVRSND